MLHGSVSIESPLQSDPVPNWAGAEHVLDLFRIPPPQIVEQLVQGSKPDHTPWAVRCRFKLYIFSQCKTQIANKNATSWGGLLSIDKEPFIFLVIIQDGENMPSTSKAVGTKQFLIKKTMMALTETNVPLN